MKNGQCKQKIFTCPLLYPLETYDTHYCLFLIQDENTKTELEFHDGLFCRVDTTEESVLKLEEILTTEK